MKRGEVWTLLDNGYASKPRPVVIMQGSAGNVFDSIIVCLITSYDSGTIVTRPRIEPTDETGLEKTSYVMTEKLLAVNRVKLDRLIGQLSERDMRRIGDAIATLLEI